jgi:hypothetical protein
MLRPRARVDGFDGDGGRDEARTRVHGRLVGVWRQAELVLVQAENVSVVVRLALRALRTVGTLELRLLAALPHEVPAQRVFAHVRPTALFARENAVALFADGAPARRA